MFDLVIFDCDGVLIDSEILSCDALIESLAEQGIDVDRDFIFRHCIGHSFPTVLEKLRALNGRQPSESFEQTYRAALLRNFEKELRTVAGVEAMLAALDVPYCIATSSSALSPTCIATSASRMRMVCRPSVAVRPPWLLSTSAGSVLPKRNAGNTLDQY